MDIHKKPFDPGTMAKLEIFEDYAAEWLPTFIMSAVPRVAIFDLFAGQGYDVNGEPGSPVRILKQVKLQIDNILLKGTKVNLYFNEFIGKKYDLLEQACNNFLLANPDVASVVRLHLSNEDFDEVFARLIPTIGGLPSLVYLDQNGVKAIAQRYFQELSIKPQTDFLYFVSSSYFWRFGESEEFKQYLDVDISEAKKDSYKFIHRYILGQIRKGLPVGTKLRLYPFSIKKGANIHGIIFGASFPLAFDKFLRIAWKKNGINGEANFDIDDDSSKAQATLWGERKLTKLETFERELRDHVLSLEIRNNADALRFAYSKGHIGSHADAVLRTMKKNGEITFDGTSPLVTYENVFKNHRIVGYVVRSKDEQK